MIRGSQGLRGEFNLHFELIPDAGWASEGMQHSAFETSCIRPLGEFDPGSGRTLAACLTHASQGAG